MSPIKALVVFILIAVWQPVISQKVIFLHHSTGAGIYSQGNVAGWIEKYNSDHGKSYQITEINYPNTPYPWENYPYDYWNLWVNNSCSNSEPNIQCLDNLCANFDVIIFKHCFPGADISPDDQTPSISSARKTIGNYKLQYRALRDLMDTYPDNKFIVWTLAPLHRLATNPQTAARAKEFVDWVKNEWLQEDGKTHANIYIFDFFNYVAEVNPSPENGAVNCLKYDYEGDHTNSDSHPNTLANQTVGPIFAEFIVKTIENQGTISVNSITVAGEEDVTTISTKKGILQLIATVLPSDATNKTVTWSIQNETGEASISNSGLVTAIADGTVSTMATANDGSGVYGTLTITITNQIVPVTKITVTGADGSNTITTRHGTLQLIAAITPEDASNKAIIWSVQNETGQAEISQEGILTAVSDGEVVAIASSMDGSNISGNMSVSISNQLETGLDNDLADAAYIKTNHSIIFIELNKDTPYEQIKIYSISGSPLVTKNITHLNEAVDVSQLMPGIYILILSGKENILTNKVILY